MKEITRDSEASSRRRGTPGAGVDALVVAAGTHTCAISLRYVTETMRPLPCDAVAGAPRFVRGLSVIRGMPVPVVDLPVLLDAGERGRTDGRFVTVDLEDRTVALRVDRVLGIWALDPARFDRLPPLLSKGDADAIEAIGVCDERLLVVLRAARILPDDLWPTLQRVEGSP